MGSNQLTLYKSADLEMNITVSFNPVDGFWESNCHFQVVFQGQSYHKVKSAVTVQISWLRNEYHCFFWSSGRILTFKGSFWNSLSSPIHHVVKSTVNVQISWHRNEYQYKFWSSGWILTVKWSFLGSFSRPIQS